MAIRIVNGFELIQVEQMQRYAMAFSFGAGKRALELVRKMGPVRETSERIVAGEIIKAVDRIFKLAFHFLAVGNIEQKSQDTRLSLQIDELSRNQNIP